MLPWLYCMFGFTVWRFLAFVFASIVNDLYFGYNLFMCLAWIVFLIANCYGWTLVYSLYLELADLTKLEDLAHLRVNCFFTVFRIVCLNTFFFQMGTMQSLNASIAHSIGNSRPTTPHSTISTAPVH